MEFTLLAAVLTTVAAMWISGRLIENRLEEVESPLDALLASAAIGLIVGRLAAMIADGVNPLTNLFQVILVRAGVMTEVAAPVAFLTLLWMWRGHLPAWLDSTAPMAVAGLAGWHGGCVWRGTCLGTMSELPWAYGIEGSSVTRHPVELYTALALLAVVPVLVRVGHAPWASTGLAISASAAVRLATQPLRPSLTGGPVAFYAVMVLVGVAIALGGHRVRVTQKALMETRAGTIGSRPAKRFRDRP